MTDSTRMREGGAEDDPLVSGMGDEVGGVVFGLSTMGKNRQKGEDGLSWKCGV